MKHAELLTVRSHIFPEYNYGVEKGGDGSSGAKIAGAMM